MTVDRNSEYHEEHYGCDYQVMELKHGRLESINLVHI